MRDLKTSEKRERRMTGTSEERFPSLLSHPLSLIFNSNIPPNAIAGEVRMAGYRPRSILPAQVANQNLGFSLYCPLTVLENGYDRSHYLVVNIYRNSAEKCRVISNNNNNNNHHHHHHHHLSHSKETNRETELKKS